jgi:hypothetical protein
MLATGVFMSKRVAALCVCLAYLCASPALAKPARPRQRAAAQADPAAYRALIDQALEDYDAQNFAEARALFLRAHELLPNARTLRGLGMVEFELRNYIDSVARLEQALASNVRPLEGELRREAEQLLVRARSYIAHVELVTAPVSTEGVHVTLDGEPIAEGQRALTMTVGEHVLLVQAPGYQDERRNLSIKGAEQQRVVVQLTPSASVTKAPVLALASTPERRDKPPLWKNPWLWTAVGLVVAGGITAGVLLGTRRDAKDPEPIPGDIGGVVQTLRFR